MAFLTDNIGRLFLWTPGQVPFEYCICATYSVCSLTFSSYFVFYRLIAVLEKITFLTKVSYLKADNGLVVNGATRNAQCATDNLSVIHVRWGLLNATLACKGTTY